MRRQKKGGNKKPIENLASQMQMNSDEEGGFEDSFAMVDMEEAQVSNAIDSDKKVIKSESKKVKSLEPP